MKSGNNPEMTQEEYGAYIEYVKKQVLDCLDEIEEEIISRIKSNSVSENFMKMMLNLALLISDTYRGKRLFICLLEYAKHINPSLANEYWGLYDNDETVIQRRFYNLTINRTPTNENGET